jgi:hypothetical protein
MRQGERLKKEMKKRQNAEENRIKMTFVAGERRRGKDKV